MIYEFLEEFILKICVSDWSKPASPCRLLLDILNKKHVHNATLYPLNKYSASCQLHIRARIICFYGLSHMCWRHAVHTAHERSTVLMC